MEILINNRITLLFSVILISFSLFSQSDDAIRDALKRSYDAEYQLKYNKAAEELLGVYIPTSYELNLRLGWLSYKSNKNLESVTYYKRAIQKMPMSIEAKLGIVYPLAALEKWDDVVKQYQTILKIDQYHATANYRLALIYYNRLDYISAWKYIHRYINLYPFDYDGNSLAGWIKYNVGKKEEASVFFKKALMVNPYDVSFNRVLGIK
jgi:tetratricopeptide (TPR) repeat protein